jgi:aerobic carbon-monoxide dehydrogenase small subunit
MPRISLTVDGVRYDDDVEPRTLLVHHLRERLGKVGTVVGCDTSNCGSCTVLMTGESVKSCTVLAVQADGTDITTVEGLAGADGALHPVQQAFIDHDGFQCGFCTSGQIMSAVALVQEGHAGSDEEIREHMSGNICRCSAYPFITDAVRDARRGMA